MTSRDRLIIGIVATLVAIAGAWFLLVQPKRDEATKLGAQISTAQQQLATAQSEVASAGAAQSTFASNFTAVARLGEAVPSDDNVPSLIYQLQDAASHAGVDFRLLKVTASGATPPPATPPTASASAAQSVTAILPPGAAVGPAGFPTMPFTFAFQGNFFHLADFFGRLQQFVVATNKHVAVSGRLMTLNAISLGPAQQGFPQITATISATTYLVPPSQGILNGATPSGPGVNSTVPAVSSPGASPAATAAATPVVR